jgi:hypothetical protein
MRGQVTAGLDNMGGTSANILTAAAADTLGGTLGTETHMHSVTGTADLTGSNTTNEGAGSSIQPTIFLNYIIKT